jgi:hypothetical protein
MASRKHHYDTGSICSKPWKVYMMAEACVECCGIFLETKNSEPEIDKLMAFTM